MPHALWFALLSNSINQKRKKNGVINQIQERTDATIYIFDKRTDATISLIKKFQLPIVRTCLKEK